MVALASPACGIGPATRNPRVLVAAIATDPGHLNPAITTSGTTHTASELLYDGLVSYGTEDEILPALAASWSVEDGARSYRFHLREGVRWHDGQPFTAADVVFTFEEMLLRYHSRTRASVGSMLDRIEAVDEHTVVFHFREPYSPFLWQLDVSEAPILPKHLYEGSDPVGHARNLAPVGTGPFRFVSYKSDVEIRYEANEHYFEPGLPRLDGVVLRVIPDAGSQLLAFESGEIDWLFDVRGLDRRRLAAEPDVGFIETTLTPGGANCVLTMSYNLESPRLADVRVRRGLAGSIDRAKLVESVYFGQARIARTPISSSLRVAKTHDLELPPYDPDEADRLLDAAGWPRDASGWRHALDVAGVADGTPLKLRFLHFPSLAAVVELIRAEWRARGIAVDQRSLEPPVFVNTVFADREFDLNVIPYCHGRDPEIGVRRLYTRENIGPVPFSNAAAYRNDGVDRAFDAAVRSTDFETRRGHYARIQEIVARELPYFWLIESIAVRAFRTTCHGFSPGGHFAKSAACEG